MDLNFIFTILAIIILSFTIRNFILMRDVAGSKTYRNIYQAVIDKDPDVINKIEEYIKQEKNEYFINKMNILLMYAKLLKDEDTSDVIEKIDYEKIFLKNNKYNKEFINLNSDMFIWTICCMPRLRRIDKLSLIKEKLDKLQDTLSNHVEYKVFYGAYAILNNNIDDSKFLNELVNGEYSGFVYDKQMIAVIKRIALSYIASLNKEKNLEFVDELKIFSETMIGKKLLIDLDIYEVYK